MLVPKKKRPATQLRPERTTRLTGVQCCSERQQFIADETHTKSAKKDFQRQTSTQTIIPPLRHAHSRYLISQTSALDAFRRWQTFNLGMPVEKGCEIVFLIGKK